MKGPSDEVVTNYLTMGGMGGMGEDVLSVWKWRNHALHLAFRVDSPWGMPLSISRHHRALTIRGTYYRNLNTCIACGKPASTLVAYRDGRWVGSNPMYFRELAHGIPPAPKPKPTVTFGSGFNDALFALTGVHSTFPAGTVVYWLLDDPSPFNTTQINVQLYKQNGAAEQLIGSSTITTNPQDAEEEDTLNPYLAPGTYQLIFVIRNTVLASGTFTIR